MKITPKWIRLKFEKRRGNNPFAKAWDEIPEDWQCSMSQGMNLDNDEIPVCAITAPPNPLLITTKRMFWRSNAAVHHIKLTEVASVEAPESRHTSKSDVSKLLVTTHSGEKYLLVTEPGKTLFVLWNLVLQFTRKQRVTVE